MDRAREKEGKRWRGAMWWSKCYAEQGTWFARVLVTGALLDQASLAGFEHK